MIFKINFKKKTCFVITPIGPKNSAIRKHADNFTNWIVKPAVEESYDVVRADDIEESGMITAQIIKYLNSSDLVIANLTGSNPNVMYELALRHVTGKPTINLMCVDDNTTDLPFDIKDVRTILFENFEYRNAIGAINGIKNYLNSIEENSNEENNPFRSAMKFIHYTDNFSNTPTDASYEKYVLKTLEDLSLQISRMDRKFSEELNDTIDRRIIRGKSEYIHLSDSDIGIRGLEGCSLGSTYDVILGGSTISEDIRHLIDELNYYQNERKLYCSHRSKKMSPYDSRIESLKAQIKHHSDSF